MTFLHMLMGHTGFDIKNNRAPVIHSVNFHGVVSPPIHPSGPVRDWKFRLTAPRFAIKISHTKTYLEQKTMISDAEFAELGQGFGVLSSDENGGKRKALLFYLCRFDSKKRIIKWVQLRNVLLIKVWQKKVDNVFLRESLGGLITFDSCYYYLSK